MKLNEITEAAERAGWNCDIKKEEHGWFVSFQTDSPYGQDVNAEFEVRRLIDVPQEVYEHWQNYDPDEEAKLWHGQNRGEPSSLRDLLADMDWVDDMLERLYNALIGRPMQEEVEESLEEQAKTLYGKCISRLNDYYDYAKPTKHNSQAKGFANPDICGDYTDIALIDYKWVLLDGYGNHYQIGCMPLEELCEMVDAIVKQCKKDGKK